MTGIAGRHVGASRRRQRFLSALICAGIALFSTPAFATFESGAKAYLDGDYATALAEWRPLAEKGMAPAQFGLGLAYENGRGVPRDVVEAAVWYRKAADQGLADAQYNLGNLYFQGVEVPHDPVQAARLFRAAAEQGMLHAQVNLGYAYETGSGVTKDEAEAVRWYRRAAMEDFPPAQYYLAAAYERGMGVNKDPGIAVAWYERAAACQIAHAENRRILLQSQGVQATPGQVPAGPPKCEEGVSRSSVAQAAAEAGGTVGTTVETLGTPSAAGSGEAAAPSEPTPPAEEPVVAAAEPEKPGKSEAPKPLEKPSQEEAPAAPVEPEAKPEVPPEAPPEAPSAQEPAAQEPAPAEPTPAELAPAEAKPAEPEAAPAESGGAVSSLSGKHRIRLAAFRDQAAAESGWKKLGKKHASVLGSLSYAISKADLGEKGIFYRLEAGPFESAKAAKAACTKIIKAGDGCAVVAP